MSRPFAPFINDSFNRPFRRFESRYRASNAFVHYGLILGNAWQLPGEHIHNVPAINRPALRTLRGGKTDLILFPHPGIFSTQRKQGRHFIGAFKATRVPMCVKK